MPRGFSVGLISLICACGDVEEPGHPCIRGPADPPSDEFRYETLHTDIATKFDHPVCAGTLADIDRHVEQVGDALGIEPTRRIPIYMSFSVEDCDADCVRANGDVIASPGSLPHELVHALTCEWDGRSDPLYEEGLAEAFDGSPSYAPDDSLDPLESFAGGGDQYAYRITSEMFVRWLYEEFGPTPLEDAFRRTGVASGYMSFANVFESAYRVPLSDAEARFLAERPLLFAPPWDQCTGSDVQWQGDLWRVDATLDCDDGVTLGPYLGVPWLSVTGNDPAMYQRFTLTGKDDREYLLQLDGIEGEWSLGEPILDWGVRVTPCIAEPVDDPALAEELDFDAEPPYTVTVWNTNSPGFYFAPGERYRIELIAPMGAPRDVQAEFVPVQ